MKNNKFVKLNLGETFEGLVNQTKGVFRNIENFEIRKEKEKEKENKNKNIVNLSLGITDICANYHLDSNIAVKNRDKEIDKVFGVFGKRKLNNVLIIGESGTGRESVIYGLAEKIVHKTCYETFKDYKVYEVDCVQFSIDIEDTQIVAYRIAALSQFLKDNPKSIVYYKNIDRLYSCEIIDVFKPLFDKYLSIGIIETDTIINEKYDFIKFGFYYIFVENPKPEELFDCVKDRLVLLQKYHKVKMNKNDFDDIVKLVHLITNEYNTGDIIDVADHALAVAQNRGFDKLNIKCIMETYRESIDKMLSLSDSTRRMYACHEAGHAIVTLNHSKTASLETVTIIPNVALEAGGYNYVTYPEEVFSKEDYMNIIETDLGGYVGTDMKGYGQNIGASADIKQASDLARSMFLYYGFDDSSAPVSYADEDGKINLGYMSERMKDNLANNVDRVLREAKNNAEKILRNDEKKFDDLINALLKKGFLTKEEILDLYNGKITVDDLPDIRDLIF